MLTELFEGFEADHAKLKFELETYVIVNVMWYPYVYGIPYRDN